MDSTGSTLRPDVNEGLAVSKNISTSEAAKMLGVSEDQVKILVKQEILDEVSPGVFNSGDVARILASRGATLTQEAAVVGSGLQNALRATLGVVRAIVTTAFAGAVVFTTTVAGFAVAYTYYPDQVASWVNQKNPGLLQSILLPEANVALGIIKFAQPTVYRQVSYQTIINPNDIFTVSSGGRITPTGPLVIPKASFLSIISTDQVANLNAQFVGGRSPGTTTGNLAIVGQVTGLADGSVGTSALADGAVTNVKLSTITDAGKIAGSAVQLAGGGGLADSSGLTLLRTCSDSQILKWNSTSSAWECQADQGSAGSGITSIREGGSTVVSSATAINFGASDFTVTESPATVGNIVIDYGNSGITRIGQNETITGTWTFPTGTVLGTDTFGANSITDSGALSIKTTTNGALTLDSGTVGAVNLGTGANSKAITVGNTTGTTSLALESGSGGVAITGATTFNSTPITLAAGSTVIDMTGAGTLGLNTTTNRAITTGTGLFTAGGAFTSTGALTADSSLTVDGNLATPKGTDYPTTGTQNNVNLGTGTFFRYTGVASATFTGLSGGTDGRILTITNASTSNLTLDYLNAGSSASNQIVTPSATNLTLGPRDGVSLQYDAGSSLWRVIQFTSSSNTLSGIAFVNGGNGFGTTTSLGTTDAQALNIITSGSTRFTVDVAAATLTGTGATTLTSSGTLTLGSGTASGITIDSGTTGSIQIGIDSSAETINVGTGAAAKIVNIGSSNTTSTTSIMSGSSLGGRIALDDAQAQTNRIDIGGNIFNGTDTVRISTNNTSADTLIFGNNNSSTSFSLTGGNKWSITSGGVITLIGAQSPDITTTAGNSLTIDSGTTGALNLGTGTTGKTIAIGGTGANTISIGTTQTAGSISLGDGMTTGTVSIGGTGAQTGTISLGTGTGVQTINLGTGGTGAKTLTLGSTASTGVTTIQSGTGNVLLQPAGTGVTGTVQIGAGGAGSTTPDVLGLDVKTDATDPTGGNGFMYYNSNLGKFRCFEGGVWKDCDTTGGTTTLQSAYNAGQTITLATGKPLSITGGDATDTVGITPTSAALTLTSGAAATWGTSTGNLNLQVGGAGATANVTIGSGSASTTPDLLVVDATTTTLPTGTNGAIIQDSTGKFNIFEGGAWKVLCNKTDAACGAGSGAALSAITAATAGNTINSGDNAQVWNWDLTTAAKTAFSFGENTASTNGAGSQYILGVSTLSASTAKPFKVTAQGTANGIEMSTAGVLSAIGTGGINATQLNGATFASPGTIGGGTPGSATFTNITDNGLTASSGVYTDASKVLTSTPPTSGVLGYWTRSGTTLSVANAGDAVTVDGTLTASNGFTMTTGALSLTSTSGSINSTGLTALTQTLASGTAAITAPTFNLNTTGTGVVGIGNGTGAVTFNSPTINLAGNSSIIDMTGTGTLGLNSTTNRAITTGTGLFTAGGNLTVNAIFDAIGNFLTPKGTDYAITGTQNDVNLGLGSLFRYTGASSATFNGLTGGTDGRFLRIMNASSSNLVIANESGSEGTATNRITTQTGADITIPANNTVSLQYDAGTTRWRVVAVPFTSSDVATIAFLQGGNAFGATATLGTTDGNILSLITGGASRFQIAAASSTLTGQGSSTVTSTSDLSVTSAAASALNITSGTTGALTLDSGSTGDVVLGAGSSAKNIKIGGTGNNVITIGNLQTGGSITLGNALTTGTITVGGTAQTGDLTLGSSSGINNLFIANGAGATTLNLANVQTGGAVNIGAGMTTGTITIGGTGAQTGTITLGGGTGAQTVNLATGGTGVKTVHIADGTAANIITIGTGQTGGSIALGSAMTTGTIDIGNSSGAMTGTINIGGSTGAQTLNFGGGNTGVKTINIGGGTAANVIAIGNAQTGGSISLGGSMTSGTVTIGGSSQGGTVQIAGTGGTNITNLYSGTGGINLLTGTTGAISIDSGTTGAITIGTGAAAKSVTLGSTNTTSSTTINAGSGGVTIGNTAANSPVTIQSGTGAINIGIATAKTIQMGNTTGATTLNLQSGTGGINLTLGPTSSSTNFVVGNSATATPDLLVLDRGTADPTGTNGGMYYNTSTNKFRCYQNGAWANCINGDKITALKTSPQSVTNSTTLASDTELQFSIAAGETWVVDWKLLVSNNNSNGPDWKAAVLGPASTTCSVVQSGSEPVGAIFLQAESADCTTPGTLVDNNINADGGIDFNVEIQGWVTAGATPGTIALQFAENTAGAGTSITVQKGSYLKAFKVGGADLAEAYASHDLTLKPGDLVSLDPSLDKGVQKSQKPYDSTALGIVSTNPGLVIGDGGGSVLVALSGRVPVKVSSENGSIKAGDYLTTSSTPGFAMKATKAGAIIGTAMTSYEGTGTGQVIAFVKNGTSNGIKIADILPNLASTGVAADGIVTNFSQQVLNQLLASTSPSASESAQMNGSEVTTDRLTATNEVITPKLTVDTLSVTKLVSSLGNSLNIEDLVNGIFKNITEYLAKVIFHSDVSFLAHVIMGTDSAGHALVKAGDMEYDVNFKVPYKNAPVVSLNVYLTGGATIDQIPPYVIFDNSINGFKIKLTRPANFDLDFGWTAVEASGEVSGASTSAGAATSASPAASAPESSATPSATPEPTLTTAATETPAATPSGMPAASESPSPTATATPVSPAGTPTPP